MGRVDPFVLSLSKHGVKVRIHALGAGAASARGLNVEPTPRIS